MNPQKSCHFGTKLVPSLQPEHECTIIPNEVCQLNFNPRTKKKPIRSEWCLDESPIQRGQSYGEKDAILTPLEYDAKGYRMSQIFKRHP